MRAQQHNNLKSPYIEVPPLAKNKLHWLASVHQAEAAFMGCYYYFFYPYQCFDVHLAKVWHTVFPVYFCLLSVQLSPAIKTVYS